MPTYIGTAVAGTGTSTASPTWPTALVLFDGVLECVTYKYPSGTHPVVGNLGTGFTFLNYAETSGLGTGVDAGNVGNYCGYRVADGSETGTDALGSPGSNSAYARMFRFTKASGKLFSFATATGQMNAGSTSFSVTFGSDPGVISGDLVFVHVGLNSDTSACSAQSLSVPGATVTTQTERDDAGTSNGDDIRQMVSTHTITAGASSGAATFTMTTSAATSGSAILIRVREIDLFAPFTTSYLDPYFPGFQR